MHTSRWKFNPDHVLYRLLPPVAHTSHNYNLRPRAHDRSLPERLTHLTDCNFIIRMSFYQVYWQYLIHACFIVLQLRSDSCQIHGYVVIATGSTHGVQRNRTHGLQIAAPSVDCRCWRRDMPHLSRCPVVSTMLTDFNVFFNHGSLRMRLMP